MIADKYEYEFIHYLYTAQTWTLMHAGAMADVAYVQNGKVEHALNLHTWMHEEKEVDGDEE